MDSRCCSRHPDEAPLTILEKTFCDDNLTLESGLAGPASIVVASLCSVRSTTQCGSAKKVYTISQKSHGFPLLSGLVALGETSPPREEECLCGPFARSTALLRDKALAAAPSPFSSCEAGGQHRAARDKPARRGRAGGAALGDLGQLRKTATEAVLRALSS